MENHEKNIENPWKIPCKQTENVGTTWNNHRGGMFYGRIPTEIDTTDRLDSA